MARQYYKDSTTGQMKPIGVKVEDTLPVGTIVEYNGQNIPEGWVEVENKVVLYENTTTSIPSEITLSDNLSNYQYIEIFYGQANGASPNIIKFLPNRIIGTTNNTIALPVLSLSDGVENLYLNVSKWRITDTTITHIRTTQKEILANNNISSTSSTSPTNIMIYKIIGYKEV